jgi:subtilisin family serine protease
VCVGATDNRDARAAFSNVGAQSVDLFAPGVSVLSTYGAGYAYLNGTSMATPHAAGVLALMRQAAPALNAAQLKQALLATADREPALTGLAVTGARVNAAAALETARAITGQPALVPYDPIPPVVTPGTAPAAPAPAASEPAAPARRPPRSAAATAPPLRRSPPSRPSAGPRSCAVRASRTAVRAPQCCASGRTAMPP